MINHAYGYDPNDRTRLRASTKAKDASR